LKILVSGASGLIGTAFSAAAASAGHQTVKLSRSGGGGASWDPERGEIDRNALEGVDAVLHLAGESIASGRWSAARKERILRSRTQGTTLLAQTLAGLTRKPAVMVSASAIGFYGDRGDEILREDSASGKDFLAQVCREWEAATAPASAAGIRVVNIRTGIVLSRKGGALPKMALPFKLFVGGKVGTGSQYMSWIHIDDEVGAILHCMMNAGIRGPVNLVSPSPVTNAEFTQTLARVLSRPAILPLPAFAARLAMGEMADALLLSSQRVEPAKLRFTAYPFRHSNLDEALRSLYT
jgi:uncharacterized protein (TIGR01777 family)